MVKNDVDPKIWNEFIKKDAKWNNHIICIVNDGTDYKKDKSKFTWDDVAIWYYKRLMKQKKEREQEQIKEYGKLIYPVAFAPVESDT